MADVSQLFKISHHLPPLLSLCSSASSRLLICSPFSRILIVLHTSYLSMRWSQLFVHQRTWPVCVLSRSAASTPWHQVLLLPLRYWGFPIARCWERQRGRRRRNGETTTEWTREKERGYSLRNTRRKRTGKPARDHWSLAARSACFTFDCSEAKEAKEKEKPRGKHACTHRERGREGGKSTNPKPYGERGIGQMLAEEWLI